MFRFAELAPRRWLAGGRSAAMFAAAAVALAGCGGSAHQQSQTAAVMHSATTGAAGSPSTANAGSTTPSTSQAGSTTPSTSQAGSTTPSTSQAGSTGTQGDHKPTGSHRPARVRPIVLTVAEQRAASSKIARSVPANVPNSVAARRNATLASCRSAAGGWQAGGTVTYAGGSAAAYKITVFFTTSNATVIGYADTVVQVAAGQTKPWTVRATFDAPKGTLCVLRGVALMA